MMYNLVVKRLSLCVFRVYERGGYLIGWVVYTNEGRNTWVAVKYSHLLVVVRGVVKRAVVDGLEVKHASNYLLYELD